MRLLENQPCVSSEKLTPEERLDALAEVLAESFLKIAENGGLGDLLTPVEDAPEKNEAV